MPTDRTDDDSLTSLLTTVLSVGITILLGLVIVGAFAGGAPGSSGTINVDPQVGTGVAIDDFEDPAASSTVRSSTGNAVFLSGDNSSIAYHVNDTVATGAWTACVWVDVADDANLNATYDVAAAANGSIQLEYDAEQWTVYYDNGTEDAALSVPAPTPTTPTTVCARYTGSELELWRNGTEVANGTLTGLSGAHNVSVDLRGRVDEVRWTNSSVSTTLLTTYADHPTAPWPGTNRLARLMLDEGSGDTTVVYFAADDTATIHNGSWTTGAPARVLVRGEDYEYGSNPWTIIALDGGALDGAPVVYIRYDASATAGVANVLSNAFTLGAVVLVLLPAVAVLKMLRSPTGGTNRR